MSTRTFSTLGVTAALAVTGIAAPAIAGAKATETGRHQVIVKSTYVYERAGVGFSGKMFKGETFKVKRLSPSGKNAYGMAYGHVNRHVWIKASALGK
jgi:hypothetical protein